MNWSWEKMFWVTLVCGFVLLSVVMILKSDINQLTQERDSICETCLLIVQDTATGAIYLYGEHK